VPRLELELRPLSAETWPALATLFEEGGDPAWCSCQYSIVCFVVGKRARRQGVGGQLLDAAITFAREHGAPALEAYPVDTSLGKPTGPTLYSGTLSTFVRAGFHVARQVESKQATVIRDIVRLDLK
jgi:GNAT superfamily N-acetyltransferase